MSANLTSVVPVDSKAVIPAFPPGVRLATLANGLTLIVCEDHRPLAGSRPFARAGAHAL